MNISYLLEVIKRVGEWVILVLVIIVFRIWGEIAVMVDWMVYWVENNWIIYIELDLDCYIFSVVGVVGLLFFDLWGWYDNI